MRFTSNQADVPTLHAYLNSSLLPTSIDKIHADFTLGSSAGSGTPQVRLSIHDESRFYNATAEEIRIALDSEDAGLDQFLLIEKDVEETGAVWYVEGWNDESEGTPVVKNGDEAVLWKLRVMTKAVPSRWVSENLLVVLRLYNSFYVQQRTSTSGVVILYERESHKDITRLTTRSATHLFKKTSTRPLPTRTIPTQHKRHTP